MSGTNQDRSVYPIVYAALTRVHPGSGRSPGLVDLPVVRDSLGYPFLPGTSLKGAFKTHYARRHKCVKRTNADYVVDCNGGNKCTSICCLFGRDEQGGSEGIAAVLVSDAYPLFLPLPEAGRGIVYVTSPFLLARAAEVLRASGLEDKAGMLERLASAASDKPRITGSGGLLYVGMERIDAEALSGSEPGVVDEIAAGLHTFYNAVKPGSALLVVPESMALAFIEKALVRMTRVRLDRETKTVVTGALWTEEYLPQGTLFLGLVAKTGFKNGYCNNINVDSVLNEFFPADGGYVIVGGKESTGGGLLKYKRLT